MSEPTRDYQPYVTLGGTPPSRLLDACTAARYQLLLALDKLRETAPNGRDYVGDRARLARADSEYTRRELALTRLMDALEVDGEYYCEVVLEREEVASAR